MDWKARLLIGLAPAIALILNFLSLATRSLHLNPERVAGFGFLFAAPWEWLIEPLSSKVLPSWHNNWFEQAVGYGLILWIPVLLYSMTIWLLVIGFRAMNAKS